MAKAQGSIISQSIYHGYIIREEVRDGQLMVHVHKLKDGKELRPHGYVMGENVLVFKLEEDH